MAFQFDAICKEISDKGIEKALKRVPEDMDATYERILDTINAKPRAQRELARKILIWIAYARRPLSIEDLAYAISIDTDTKSLKDLESSLPTEESILGACANLISVDRNQNPYVRFVHFSVQEFLTRYRATALDIGYEVAHREIAQACMVLLTLLPNQRPGIHQPTFDEWLYYLHTRDLHGIHHYAVDEWPHHLLAGNLSGLPVDDQIVTLTLSLFKKSPILPTKQHMHLEGYRSTAWQPGTLYVSEYTMWGHKIYLKFSPAVLALIFDLPDIQRHLPLFPKQLEKEQFDAHGLKCIVIANDKLAIHYATAELDCVPVVRRLHNHGYTLNYSYSNPDGANSSVLEWLQLSPLYSVQCTKMAKYLLDNDICIEPQGLRNTSADPLKHFARKEDWGIEVFELLLDRVVEPVDGMLKSAQVNERLQGALHAAVEVDRSEAVRLLIDKGADVNTQGGKYGNALQAAVCRAKTEIIQLLLDKGADVSGKGGEYGNALHTAVIKLIEACTRSRQRGHSSTGANRYRAVIQLLIHNGVGVNAQDGSALQAAVHSGNVEVIQLLLDEGVDVNAQGGEYGNALRAAVYTANVEVIQLLLDKGADVNIQGGEYGSALQAAVIKNNLEVIQLLLDEGADANAQGGEYGNPLQAAVYDGNYYVTQLLLDKGADVNAQGGKYGNPLQAAVYDGNYYVIRLLLDKGADVNAQGGEYGSALQAAVIRDNVDVIQLLLDVGADVNAQGGVHGSPLQAAVYKGNYYVIRLLLDKGADVNAQGGEYGSALQAAVIFIKDNVHVIQLLLDVGADVNSQGGVHGSPLQAAVYKGNYYVIRLLLDVGADVNAQGGSALPAAIYNGNIGVIQLLLDKGADVNAQGGEYGSALQAAVIRDNVEVIGMLLNRGVNLSL